MRKIFEPSFYVLYLALVLILGTIMIIKNKNKKEWLLIGLGFVLLGLGDAFHLIPRAIGIIKGTIDNPDIELNKYLGLGKLMTSLTMTFFYLLFYHFLFKRFKVERNKYVDLIIYLLVLIRIVLCFLPQNKWLTNDGSLLIGITRNIPFVIIGLITIIYSIKFKDENKNYKLLFLYLILSFLFYLPVVFFSHLSPYVGFLMLPKTICYLIILIVLFKDLREVDD